jgi:hypothetical protein
MVNAMVLADAYDLDFRFAWLDRFDLNGSEACEIFDAEFLSRYQVSEADLAGRPSIVLSGPAVEGDEETTSLAAPGFLEVDWPIGLHPAVLALGDDGARRFASAFLSIPLSGALQSIVEQIDALGNEPWTGFHVRAGDVVTGEWRRTMWHEKYPVSPLLRRSIRSALDDGRRVVLVTDNPEYARWLVEKCPGAHTTVEVFGDEVELTALQRAMADLLLLSSCKTVIAPARSAFSTLASLIGDCSIVRLTETVSRETARLLIDQGVLEQLADPARTLLDPFTARDLVWFVDAFCDFVPARALLKRARTATILDADFTSAWARRARLAARCGRFREAWRAVDMAEATARDDQLQDDSAVDAELALAVVGCLELIERGWRLAERERTQRLNRIERVVSHCGTRRPHHWQKPAIDTLERLIAETQFHLAQPRRVQFRLAPRLRRRLRGAFVTREGQTPFAALGSGNCDAFALDVSGLVRLLAGH